METRRRTPSATLSRMMSSMDDDTIRRTRDRMLIAGKIHDAMKMKGISQRKLAEMLGKSESEISELLSGNRNFGLDTLSDISHCLKLDLLQVSRLPTVRIPNTAVEAKVTKLRGNVFYYNHSSNTVPVTFLGWQTSQYSGNVVLV